MENAVLFERFKTLDKKRKSYLARHICAALNYSFKYDRVSSFKELIKIHRMMAITKEEVDAYIDLFIAECYPKSLPQLSVQRRVMARVGKLIVDGYSNEIESEEVLFFYRALRKSNIMLTKFMDVNLKDIHQILTEIRSLLKSGVANERLAALSKYQSFNITGPEFDEFTKLYLQMHDSKVDFIQRVKPIIKKIRGYVVNEKAEDMKKLYHEITVNPVFCWHLRSILFESLIKMANAIFKFVEDPKNLENMDEIVHLHRDLKISGEEVDEFESLFLRMFSQEDKFVVNFKVVIAEFKMRLLPDE